MRDYGKVSPQFWIGETGRKLRGSLEAQVVAAYLITGPSAHQLGIYYLPIPTISHDTGLSIAGATKGLRRVIEAGFAAYDEASCFVWVPEMARIQVAETMKPGDNRLVWTIGELMRVKIPRFVAAFVEKYGDAWQLENAPKWEQLARVIEGASKAHRSQEQEHEQEVSERDSSPSTNDLFGSESAERTTVHARVASISPATTLGFEDWYAAYPRKEARGDAEKAWGQMAKERPALVDLLAVLAWQRPIWAAKEPQYTPLPATYLRQKRWLDQRPTGGIHVRPDAPRTRTSEDADKWEREKSRDARIVAH